MIDRERCSHRGSGFFAFFVVIINDGHSDPSSRNENSPFERPHAARPTYVPRATTVIPPRT